MSDNELRGASQTLLMTLFLHALDARAARPILGDRYAAPILDHVPHDHLRLELLRGNRAIICARARVIDDAVRAFLDAHPDAVVLHLGCGLDSRVLRIDPGPQVTWLEVDQPKVISIREAVYAARPGVTSIAASVPDSHWWSQIPSGRPLLTIAEGLFMYLKPAQVRATLHQLAGLAGSPHTLLADTTAGWVSRASRMLPINIALGASFASTTADFGAAVRHTGAFHTTSSTSLITAAARLASGPDAVVMRAAVRLPAGRKGLLLHTLRGGDPHLDAVPTVE